VAIPVEAGVRDVPGVLVDSEFSEEQVSKANDTGSSSLLL